MGGIDLPDLNFEINVFKSILKHIMSKRYSALVMSAVFLVSGCLTNPPIVGEPLTGRWQGNVKQIGPGNARAEYPAKIKLDGSKGGTIDYPSLGCQGRLEYAGMQGKAGIYQEKISVAGLARCINNGRVSISSSGAQIDFRWEDPRITVTGTLLPVRN